MLDIFQISSKFRPHSQAASPIQYSHSEGYASLNSICQSSHNLAVGLCLPLEKKKLQYGVNFEGNKIATS